MEAFSLLKYWRGGGGVVVGGGDYTLNSRATTIVTALAQKTIETDDDDEDDDDGPFFDLEFAVPDEEEDGEEDREDKRESNGVGFEEENSDVESDDDDDDGEGQGEGEGTDCEREFNFTLSSGSSNDRVDQNLPLSPSDDLFFKGRLVPIEPSSLVINGSEPNSKLQLPVSLLKSATKFRVFMLGFKKSKMKAKEKANEKNGETSESAASPTPKQQQQQKQAEKGEEVTRQSKLFTVKFKVEEVPIVSLFTRENSKNAKSSQKQSNAEEATAAASDEKRFSKDVMHKYLKKVKPLYIRVSKRYGEKLRFSGQLSLGSSLKTSAPPPQPPIPPSTAATVQKSSPSAEKSQPETQSTETASVSNVKSLKQGNLPAGLRVVCKHLGKSRSASSAVAAAPSAPVISRRRDDSLLLQEDGIQSAILHCKRSFNATRDSDSSLLSRSASDPSHESVEFSRKSSDEGKLVSNKNGS